MSIDEKTDDDLRCVWRRAYLGEKERQERGDYNACVENYEERGCSLCNGYKKDCEERVVNRIR